MFIRLNDFTLTNALTCHSIFFKIKNRFIDKEMNLQINETISVHLSITTYKTVNTKPGVSKVWAQGQTGTDVNCAMVSMLE